MKRLTLFLLTSMLILIMAISLTGMYAGDSRLVEENAVEITPQGLMDSDELAKYIGNDVVYQMQEQALAVEAYNYLLDKMLTDKEGSMLYPDNYGGEYIEKGNLIILLANASFNEKKVYLDLLSDYKSVIIIRDVEYSINDLNYVAEDFMKKLDDSVNKSFHIDPRKNKVVITVPQSTLENKLNTLETSIHSQNLPIIIESINEMTPMSSLYGGDKIYSSTGGGYTLGICGTYGGNPAILTAGHGWSLNNSAYLSGYPVELIGPIVQVRFDDGLIGDYAIAKVTNSLLITTNRVRSSVTTYPIKGTLSLPVGGLGYRFGAISGLQALEVTALNKTEQIKDPVTGYYKYIRGLTLTKHISGQYSAQGDSGGPYYAMNTSSQWCLVGTAVAGSPQQNSNQIVAINPISNVSGFTVKTN